MLYILCTKCNIKYEARRGYDGYMCMCTSCNTQIVIPYGYPDADKYLSTDKRVDSSKNK